MVEVNLELIFTKFQALHLKRAKDQLRFIEKQFQEQTQYIEQSYCKDAKIWLIFLCQQERIKYINQVVNQLAQKGPYEANSLSTIILNFYEKNLGEFSRIVSQILIQINGLKNGLSFDQKHAHLDTLYQTWNREDDTLPTLSKLNQLNNYYAHVQHYLDNPSTLEKSLNEDQRYLEKLKEVLQSFRHNEIELKLIKCLSMYLETNISIAKEGVSVFKPTTWLYEAGIAALKRKIAINTIYELFNIYQWMEKTRNILGSPLDEHAHIALNYCTLPRRFELIKKILINAIEEESKSNISPVGVTGIFHYRRPKLLQKTLSVDCETILRDAKQEMEQHSSCFSYFLTGLPGCYSTENSSISVITLYYNTQNASASSSLPTYEEAVSKPSYDVAPKKSF